MDDDAFYLVKYLVKYSVKNLVEYLVKYLGKNLVKNLVILAQYLLMFSTVINYLVHN